MADYPYGKCDRWTRALGDALASTTAGTLALGVIEAARETLGDIDLMRAGALEDHLVRTVALESALSAYDQATPHLINTDIGCDGGGETPGGSD